MDPTDELMVRSLQETATLEESRRIAAWRMRSKENAHRYAWTRRIWDLGAALRDPAATEPVPTIDDLLRWESGGGGMSHPSPASVAQTRWRRWMSRVLPVAALLVAGFLVRYSLPGTDGKISLGTAEFVTGPAETVTVTLGDGSLVRLAPASRLRVMESRSDGREVWLDGRAYFAVMRHPGSPFRVRTHAGDAHVLGTRFDIQAHSGDLTVMVVEGNVEMDSGRGRVALAENEVGTAHRDTAPVRETVDARYVRDALDWMGNFLVFQGTPLSKAAEELSLHYGIPVTVMDSTLARETVHGWFADEELSDVLRVVCRAVRGHCSVRPDGVSIEP